MAIDASIPLMAQAPKADPMQGIAQTYQLADLINKHKADQDLRQALSDPNSIDPATGQIRQSTLADITRANPTAGMALQKNAADLAQKQSTINKNNAQAKNFDYENGVKQMDALAQAGGSLMTQYSNLLKQGVPQEQAIAQVQPLYEKSLESLRNGGLIDAQHFAQAPKQFNPDQVANGVFQALSVKDQFAALHQQNQEALDQSKASETVRHNRTDEGLKGQSNAIAGENAATNRGRLNFEEAKPLTEIGKLNSDYTSGKIAKTDHDNAVAKATAGSDPAVIDEVAKHIADGSMPPMTGQAMRTPGGMRTMARVYELNPDYDAKNYGTQARALKDFSTGKQGNTIRSLNVSMDHLDTLSQLSTELKNGNMQAVNKLSNQIASQTGHAAPTNFNAAKKIVADEIVKGIVGSGGGVSDREEAAKAIDGANSPAQLAGVISTYKKLLGGQLDGLKKQYVQATGRQDFDKQFLTSKSQSLENGGVPLPGQGAAPAGAAQPPLPPAGAGPQPPSQAGAPATAPGAPAGARTPPPTNPQGWTLHRDKNGNMAYVSPDGKQFQQVQ